MRLHPICRDASCTMATGVAKKFFKHVVEVMRPQVLQKPQGCHLGQPDQSDLEPERCPQEARPCSIVDVITAHSKIPASRLGRHGAKEHSIPYHYRFLLENALKREKGKGTPDSGGILSYRIISIRHRGKRVRCAVSPRFLRPLRAEPASSRARASLKMAAKKSSEMANVSTSLLAHPMDSPSANAPRSTDGSSTSDRSGLKFSTLLGIWKYDILLCCVSTCTCCGFLGGHIGR